MAWKQDDGGMKDSVVIQVEISHLDLFRLPHARVPMLKLVWYPAGSTRWLRRTVSLDSVSSLLTHSGNATYRSQPIVEEVSRTVVRAGVEINK